MNAVARLWACEAGQSIVETALCLPILLLLLGGVVDLGRLSQFDVVASSAARAGTQYGSQSSITAQDLTGMQSAATNDAPGVTAVAFSYYKCADGSAPTTAYSGQTMADQRIIQNGCKATHQNLYVVVSATATFKPLFLTFLGKTITAVSIAQVPT